MSGGPSQLDSFDYRPELMKRQGEGLPDSYLKGKRPPGMAGSQTSFPLVPSAFEFKQHGQSGAWVSEMFPETAKVVDDLCFIKSMTSEAVNHDPALTFMQTGAPLPGRPSIGSWLQYGLGTDNRDLPGFIVLISRRPVDQPLSYRLWDAGFLPTQYQGVQFRAGKDAVLYLSEPEGIARGATRKMLDTLKAMHERQFVSRPDAEITARIEQYEMAFRMQLPCRMPRTSARSRNRSFRCTVRMRRHRGVLPRTAFLPAASRRRTSSSSSSTIRAGTTTAACP